mmetsp:Transcript_11816/g.32227  ORF Transcript_11816/g.32227 Transcript_11816/m.32227 type:complete len:228 (-) Transcript_11816:801-1484(-)
MQCPRRRQLRGTQSATAWWEVRAEMELPMQTQGLLELQARTRKKDHSRMHPKGMLQRALVHVVRQWVKGVLQAAAHSRRALLPLLWVVRGIRHPAALGRTTLELGRLCSSICSVSSISTSTSSNLAPPQPFFPFPPPRLCSASAAEPTTASSFPSHHLGGHDRNGSPRAHASVSTSCPGFLPAALASGTATPTSTATATGSSTIAGKLTAIHFALARQGPEWRWLKC